MVAHALTSYDVWLSELSRRIILNRLLEIDTPACLFPIAVAGRIEAATTTDFLLALRHTFDTGLGRIAIRRIRPGFGVLGLILRVLYTHGESMPEQHSSCSQWKHAVTND